MIELPVVPAGSDTAICAGEPNTFSGFSNADEYTIAPASSDTLTVMSRKRDAEMVRLKSTISSSNDSLASSNVQLEFAAPGLKERKILALFPVRFI